jgi:DNA primase
LVQLTHCQCVALCWRILHLADPLVRTTRLKGVVLGLDGDQGGREATEKLAERFAQAGLEASVCSAPQDGRGKDWNERWKAQLA